MMFDPLLQLAQLSLDTKVSLETVIGIFVWVISFVVFMTTVRDDVKTIKDWVRVHQRESDKRDTEMALLGRVSERLTTLIESLTDRVDRIEQTCDRRHAPRTQRD